MSIVLISGSTRAKSSNTAALRTARALAPDGVEVVLYDGLADLPAFTPDASPDAPHPAVAALRDVLAGADAVVFCTPEYAGTLPGSLKNLLDWTVGTADLYEKPVAWITTAVPGRGEGAQATLRLVLGYVGAEVIEPACGRVPVTAEMIDADGTVTDPGARAALAGLVARLATELAGRAERV